MKNIFIGIAIGVVLTIGAIALAGFYRFNFTDGGDILPLPPTPSEPFMTEADARTIAEASCIKGGEALGVGTYNPNSMTWWFDANLNATQPGCNPACVVSEETGTAEINWRCTGLIPPTDTTPTSKTPPATDDSPVSTGLTGKTWVLTSATQADGTPLVPTRKDAFTLTFKEDGSVGIGTDCNTMGGQYTASGSGFGITNIFSTMMYCEGSKESEFSALLSEVSSYQITSGALILKNKTTGVTIQFK